MVDWNPKVLNESQTCPIVGHQSASICVPVIVIPFAQIGLPQPNADPVEFGAVATAVE